MTAAIKAAQAKECPEKKVVRDAVVTGPVSHGKFAF